MARSVWWRGVRSSRPRRKRASRTICGGFGSHLFDEFVFVRCLAFLLQPSEDADVHAAELGAQHADGKGEAEDAEDAEGRHERLAAVRGRGNVPCALKKTPR